MNSLHETIHDHQPSVLAIVNHNSDHVQEPDNHGSSAVHVASPEDYLQILGRWSSETRLFDAATTGEVTILEELLATNPALLRRVSHTHSNTTPLHVATFYGQRPFVQAILQNDNSDLAQVLDNQGSSALHVASSKGHLQIVQDLLSAAPDMCRSLNNQGRNPLHLAAMKGHVPVLKMLVQKAPSAARVKLNRNMTVLHLCVEYGQLKALEILVPCMKELVNERNDDGDTVLHLAVRNRDIQIVKFLCDNVRGLDVKACNRNGLTPTKLLSLGPQHADDPEIKEVLKDAGRLSIWETILVPPRGLRAHMLFERQRSLLEENNNALMVAASVLATMTFQVGVNPPIKIWEEDKINKSLQAYFDFLMIHCAVGYAEFYIINTASFIASLSIILLLISGLPLRNRVFMWILMVVTWTAITTVAVTYIASIYLLAPSVERLDAVLASLGTSVLVSFGLLGLVLILHLVRWVVNVLKLKAKVKGCIRMLLYRRRTNHDRHGSMEELPGQMPIMCD